jgi:RimJ/RimL family protein N-acetyltransferase
MRFLGGRTVPPEAVPGVVQGWIDDWETYPAGKFIVERRDDGAVVGRVGLKYYDPETWERSAARNAQPELGWAVAREHWGRGYATEAARAVWGWARDDRLISLITAENVRSQAVARRLGARPAGTVAELEGSGPHVIWVHP